MLKNIVESDFVTLAFSNFSDKLTMIKMLEV